MRIQPVLSAPNGIRYSLCRKFGQKPLECRDKQHGWRSPVSLVLSRRYDFLSPVPPHFVTFAWRYRGAHLVGSISAHPDANDADLELVTRCSSRDIPRRRQDLPSSWGTRCTVCSCSPTPAGPRCPTTIDIATRPPTYTRRRLPAFIIISRLNSTAFRLAVYASQEQSPVTTQDSLPAAGQALPDGIGCPQGSNERFQTHIMLVIPLSQTSWRKYNECATQPHITGYDNTKMTKIFHPSRCFQSTGSPYLT